MYMYVHKHIIKRKHKYYSRPLTWTGCQCWYVCSGACNGKLYVLPSSATTKPIAFTPNLIIIATTTAAHPIIILLTFSNPEWIDIVGTRFFTFPIAGVISHQLTELCGTMLVVPKVVATNWWPNAIPTYHWCAYDLVILRNLGFWIQLYISIFAQINTLAWRNSLHNYWLCHLFCIH